MHEVVLDSVCPAQGIKERQRVMIRTANLQRLCVTVTSTDAAISWVGGISAGVTNSGAHNSPEASKRGFRVPANRNKTTSKAPSRFVVHMERKDRYSDR
jgi:hypothetical protein